MPFGFNHRVDNLVDRIKPILANHAPDLQGAVIADLFAIYIAGHPEDVRRDVMAAWIDMVRGLLAIYNDENSLKKNSKKNKENPRIN